MKVLLLLEAPVKSLLSQRYAESDLTPAPLMRLQYFNRIHVSSWWFNEQAPLDDSRVAGKSLDRPWERIGSLGGTMDTAKLKKYPNLNRESDGAAEAAEEMNDKGIEFFRSQDYRGAWECYTEAVRLAPDKPVYRANRAAAGLKRARYRDAIADCKHALRCEPTYAKALVRLGQAHAGQDSKDDYKEAKRALEHALEIDPQNATAKKALKDVEIALEAEDSSDDD